MELHSHPGEKVAYGLPFSSSQISCTRSVIIESFAKYVINRADSYTSSELRKVSQQVRIHERVSVK